MQYVFIDLKFSWTDLQPFTHGCRSDINFDVCFGKFIALVQDSYRTYRTKYPNATLLMAIHEYCVFSHHTDPGDPLAGSFFLNEQQKIIFRNTLNVMVDRFENCCLVAGTIAYLTPFEGERMSKTARLRAAALIHPDNPYRFNLFAGKTMVVLKNRCYIFLSSDIRNTQHCKTYFAQNKACGWKENLLGYARDDEQAPYNPNGIIFQPGSTTPLITLPGNLLLAVEICEEHCCGYLKRQLDERIIPQPDIHLVISNSIKDPFPQYMVGKICTLFADYLQWPDNLGRDCHNTQRATLDNVEWNNNVTAMVYSILPPILPPRPPANNHHD
jgi:hypothetical protein